MRPDARSRTPGSSASRRGTTCWRSRTTSRRYAGTAAEIAGFVRGHWDIENGLHWVLDVVFREDRSRVRQGYAGSNLAMIRRVAVSLLRRAPGKGSSVTKRLKAGWDENYMLQVLQGIDACIVR